VKNVLRTVNIAVAILTSSLIVSSCFLLKKTPSGAVEELPKGELQKLQNTDEFIVTGAGGIDYEIYNSTEYDLKEITIRVYLQRFQDQSIVYDKHVAVPLDTYYVKDGSNTGQPRTVARFSRQDNVVNYEGPPARINFGGILSAKGVAAAQ
jgi:hypothetical protein